ncbi:MAG: YetF domain-containing protein [Nitrososphaeraceae archaeon]
MTIEVRISKVEFESYLRLSGTDDVSEIKLYYLKINGQISFIKKKGKD